MNYSDLTKLKHELDRLRPLPRELVRNLDDWFRVELTYTSNAIEGNTLTRRETAVVLEQGITIGGKSLKDHLEATNHAQALDFVHGLAKKNIAQLTEEDILGIHAIILKGIEDEHAGQYRKVPVRIAGSTVIMPNPLKVPTLMQEFMTWLKTATPIHPVAFAGEAHYRLVTIHPFVDGNGRTARLLMNLILINYGYPPAIIRKQDRLPYLGALEQSQLGGSKKEYDQLIAKAAQRSLRLYLDAAQGKTSKAENDALLKIGALAKAAQESVPTIRFWTHEGLLSISDSTERGYHLYSFEMVERCQKIRELKNQRLSLQEIKEKLRWA